MDINYLIRIGKISLVLFLSFFISSLSVENVFLANSPKIRPNLPGFLMAKITATKDNILAKINFDFNLFPSPSRNNTVAESQTVQFLKESLKPVTKGVSAASKDEYSYTKFKVNEIEWARVTYTLKSGKTITIEYPKGTEPPPKEIYEEEKE